MAGGIDIQTIELYLKSVLLPVFGLGFWFLMD